MTEEHKRKISQAMKGHTVSKETRKKLSIARKGKYKKEENSFYGKHHTEETKQALKEQQLKIREKSSKRMLGKKNPIWKGNNVGYTSLHDWIRKHKPKPQFCEICNERQPKEVANISGNYKRNINDFKWTCHKCHREMDGISDNLRKFGKNQKGKTYEQIYGIKKEQQIKKKLCEVRRKR